MDSSLLVVIGGVATVLGSADPHC